MHEAKYYNILQNHKVQCNLCPWNCIIAEGKSGTCKVRKNIDGKLFSLVYGKPVSTHIDPIEKKPLFHFFPGEAVLSLGTFGCNLFCEGCQNYDISKEWEEEQIENEEISPEKIIQIAKKNNCRMIAFTYNEPTVFFEYMLDIAKLAKKEKKEKIRCVMVSNGYINQEPLTELCKYIEAANIDLKGFSEEFYKRWTKGSLQPVLDTIKTLKASGVWVELTTLIIPGENDDPKEIEKMCKWIAENVGIDVPLHFSRFFPMYKAEKKAMTPTNTLINLKKIADRYLNYVYVGNIHDKNSEKIENFENTVCPKCKKVLVEREGYRIRKNNLNNNRCIFCNTRIEGIFEKK